MCSAQVDRLTWRDTHPKIWAPKPPFPSVAALESRLYTPNKIFKICSNRSGSGVQLKPLFLFRSNTQTKTLNGRSFGQYRNGYLLMTVLKKKINVFQRQLFLIQTFFKKDCNDRTYDPKYYFTSHTNKVFKIFTTSN